MFKYCYSGFRFQACFFIFQMDRYYALKVHTAKASSTRILAVSVDALDDLLERARDFARRVLEMERDHLRQMTP